MDRLPLRLLAFAMGPLIARRAAGASRAAAVAGKTPRALARPPDGATASEDVAPAEDVAHSSPWLLASAGAAAVGLAAIVASQEKGPEPQRRQQTQTPPAKNAMPSEDFGGV